MPEGLSPATSSPARSRPGNPGAALVSEVTIHACLVIYQLRGTDLYVLNLVHKRRAPGPEDLRG